MKIQTTTENVVLCVKDGQKMIAVKQSIEGFDITRLFNPNTVVMNVSGNDVELVIEDE